MRRRHRGQARPRGKTPVAWANSVFNTAFDVDGTLTEFILCDSSDFSWVDSDAAVSGLSKPGHVLRSLGTMGVAFATLTTALQQGPISLAWAVYVLGNDDPDNDLLITSGALAILNKVRVIQTGVEPLTLTELPTAQYGTNFTPGIKIAWDVRTRIRIKPDESLILGLQTSANITAVVSGSATATCIARTLLREP